MRRNFEAGFTLIEVMIVVAIIAVIAAIAIPGLLRARISSNETSAIGTLKSLATAQQQFQQQCLVDQDFDGAGEYGVLQEMAGTVPCRASGLVADPTFMAVPFGTSAAVGVNGAASSSGYDVLVYLPNAIGIAMNERVLVARGAVALDANVQESCWVAYAWPTDLESSGVRVFGVNQEGQVYQSSNALNRYDGAMNMVQGDAAFSVAGDITGPMDVGGPGQGGDPWLPVGG